MAIVDATIDTKIDTKTVAGRRQLKFQSLDDIAQDVESLAAAKELKSLGNWSPGQIFKHLAIVMHGEIDGLSFKIPWPMRIMISIMLFFMKSRFLNSPMPAGFALSPGAMRVLVPPPTSLEDGLEAIRSGLHRLKTESHRAPHAFMGRLTEEEWTKLQCRHCELHLSFLAPISAPESVNATL